MDYNDNKNTGLFLGDLPSSLREAILEALSDNAEYGVYPPAQEYCKSGDLVYA